MTKTSKVSVARGRLTADAFYRERANGRWSYWTYSDSNRIFLNPAWASQQIDRGTATLIKVKE